MVHCVLAQRIPKTLEKLVKTTLVSFFFQQILFAHTHKNSFSGGEKLQKIGSLAGFSFNISPEALFFFLVDDNVTKTKTNRKNGKKEFWGQLDLPSQIRKKLGVIASQKIFRDGSTMTVTGPVKIKFSQGKKNCYLFLMAIFFETKMEGQQGGWLKTGNSQSPQLLLWKRRELSTNRLFLRK